MSTIPASQIVDVAPSVLEAGGSAIDLNGLMLTTNARIPVGEVRSFGSLSAVENVFGASDAISRGAAVYFGGYEGSTKKPGALLMAQYPLAAVSAYLRGGDASDIPLATLQGYSGVLNVTIDGVLKTDTIDLSTATSFSNAAFLIGDALGITGVTAGSFTGSIASTTLTVASALTAVLAPGQVLSGSGVTSGTYITAQLTGPTGGLGTYSVSVSQTASSTSITAKQPAVQYDSVSGAFTINSGTTGNASTITFGSGALADDLLLTSALGAVLSQGANAAVPATFMAGVIAISTNWALFATAFDPDQSGFANRLAFSAWANSTGDRYGYVPTDDAESPTTTVPATASFMYAVTQAGYSGTIPVWEPDDLDQNWFVLGWAASLDFEQANGRATLAFRSQSGIVPGVTDGEIAINLGGNPQVVGDRGNGYNFYGTYGSGNAGFTFMNRGFVSGAFKWADSYVIQIWLNNSLQVAWMNYLTAIGSTSFNAAGYTALEQALAGAIAAGLNFGAYVPGVELSSAQIAAVNAAAGKDIATTLQNRGWYLQITPSSASVRASRGPVAGRFWYVDGQSIQSINLGSVAVQ